MYDSQRDYSTKKVYSENPLEVAKTFEDNGIKYLTPSRFGWGKIAKNCKQQVLEDIAQKPI